MSWVMVYELAKIDHEERLRNARQARRFLGAPRVINMPIIVRTMLCFFL